MTTLLSSATAVSATATEGDVKNLLTNLRTYMADLLGTDSANKQAVLAALSAPLNGSVSKTGAYTVVAADRGKVIACTGTFTLTLQAAATLGDGFVFAVRNTGTGSITVDPNLTETIDGQTTMTVSAGEMVIIYCDGAGFVSAGGGSGGTAGEVAFFARATAPAGWLVADGSLVSRTTYSRLFLAIGTTFGAGDGSTTFKLPDLRGEFLRALDGGRGVDTGRTLGSAQASQNLAHTHSVTKTYDANGNGTEAFVKGYSYSASAESVTSSGGTEARPRNVALLCCIRT